MTFKYTRDRKVEDVVRNAKEKGGSYDSYLDSDCTFYKAKEGDCHIRIMPRSWNDTAVWGRGWHIKVQIHRNVGADKGTYLCLKMLNKRCPVCEAKEASSDEDEADRLRAQARILCWIIDRSNERAGPQIMSMPVSLFRDISQRSLDKESESVIYIDDPEEGFDITFVREGTDKKTKWTGVEVLRKSSPLHKDLNKQKVWLDFITKHPLPDSLVYFDYEHISQVLYGRTDRDDTSGDTDPRGARRLGADEEVDRGGARRRPSDDDEGRGEHASRGRYVEEDDDRGSRRRPSDDDEDRGSRRRSSDDYDDDDRGSRRRPSGDYSDPPFEDDRASSRRRPRDVEDDPPSARRSGDDAASTPRYRPKDSDAALAKDDDNSPIGQVRSSLSRMRGNR